MADANYHLNEIQKHLEHLKHNRIRNKAVEFGTAAAEQIADDTVEFLEFADPIKVVEDVIHHSGRDIGIGACTALLGAHIVMILVVSIIGAVGILRVAVVVRKQYRKRKGLPVPVAKKHRLELWSAE